jgi:hypothetical protein
VSRHGQRIRPAKAPLDVSQKSANNVAMASGSQTVKNSDGGLSTNSVTVNLVGTNTYAYDGKMRRRIERQYTYLPSSSSYLLTNEVHFIYDGNVVAEERKPAMSRW